MRLCDTSPRSKSMKALKMPRNKHIGFMQKYKGKYFHIVLSIQCICIGNFMYMNYCDYSITLKLIIHDQNLLIIKNGTKLFQV